MMGHAHLEIRERLFDTCLLDDYDKVVSSSFDISDESTLTEGNDMEWRTRPCDVSKPRQLLTASSTRTLFPVTAFLSMASEQYTILTTKQYCTSKCRENHPWDALVKKLFKIIDWQDRYCRLPPIASSHRKTWRLGWTCISSSSRSLRDSLSHQPYLFHERPEIIDESYE